MAITTVVSTHTLQQDHREDRGHIPEQQPEYRDGDVRGIDLAGSHYAQRDLTSRPAPRPGDHRHRGRRHDRRDGVRGQRGHIEHPAQIGGIQAAEQIGGNRQSKRELGESLRHLPGDDSTTGEQRPGREQEGHRGEFADRDDQAGQRRASTRHMWVVALWFRPRCTIGNLSASGAACLPGVPRPDLE
ncbi:hypothetical protein ACFVUS_24820 [Nocardia sp. NPDC058058]|uniref:hypothetical protein n=1 Tax=Nocardia sp. NPDC058058 TaxID=3346317 RepID=UPI0036DDAE88